VQKHLQNLFGTLGLHEQDRDVLVEEAEGVKVEIMHTGSAMRKAFHALVFLYTLASATQTKRVFFIEGTPGVVRSFALVRCSWQNHNSLRIEPEALLCNELQKSFVNLVLDVAQRFKIQVFMTSNANKVYDFFTPQVPFMDGQVTQLQCS
jgi:hypothetical protein